MVQIYKCRSLSKVYYSTTRRITSVAIETGIKKRNDVSLARCESTGVSELNSIIDNK